MSFDEEAKRKGFVTIISPLKAGPRASSEEEKMAVPVVEGTIPVHADLMMGAAIVTKGASAAWKVGGGDVVRERVGRKLYLHLPMVGKGAQVRVAGETVLREGDGAFVSGVDAGDEVLVESVGQGEAEVVVLDSNGVD